MNISDAIAQLKRLDRQHGGDVAVFFDCPSCKQAFTPDFTATVKAVVIEARKPEEAKC